MSASGFLRVLCLTTLPTSGAGNRLRVEQYAAPLRSNGIELVVSSFFDEPSYRVLYLPGRTLAKGLGTLRGIARRLRDAARAGRFDLVLVYRESAPIGPPLFERLLRIRRKPFVFDFDDAIFLGPIHPANRRWAWLRKPTRVLEATQLAAAVTTVNEYLAEWARRSNRDVAVIPTPVDTERFHPRSQRAGGHLVVGWIGSSTTAPYLHMLDDALSLLADRFDFTVRVIGGTYRHPRVRVEEWPWQLDTEPADIATFDIGVVPEPDDPWTQGKGGFKAMLYMAVGIPVVASRVGVNPQVVREGETGFCVGGTSEWVKALEQLATNAALRERLGSAGRDRVEKHYSLRAHAPRLADVLTRAAGRSR